MRRKYASTKIRIYRDDKQKIERIKKKMGLSFADLIRLALDTVAEPDIV
ncbi:MAG: hypothetical protein ACC630_05360 [Nitrospinota bacterium]